ncbi:MAG: 3-oxoacyl-[acyl-carrier-protein] reductase [Chitinophagales bacterium]
MDNKYALITGASRGIGKAIALKIAKMDYTILVNYRSNEAAADATVEEIKTAGGKAEKMPFDVSDPKAIETAMDAWKKDHPEGNIEVLVNNAGIRKDNLMMLMKDEEWNDVISTNLNSFFHVTRSVIKGMISNRYGRIINIVSLSGVKGMPGQTNYSAAKAGVIAATKSLAQEMGRRKITVNAVAPGFIETDMTEDIPEENFKNLIPLRRFGKPEEVAAIVNFLASSESAYITGEVIHVNGGIYT